MSACQQTCHISGQLDPTKFLLQWRTYISMNVINSRYPFAVSLSLIYIISTTLPPSHPLSNVVFWILVNWIIFGLLQISLCRLGSSACRHLVLFPFIIIQAWLFSVSSSLGRCTSNHMIGWPMFRTARTRIHTMRTVSAPFFSINAWTQWMANFYVIYSSWCKNDNVVVGSGSTPAWTPVSQGSCWLWSDCTLQNLSSLSKCRRQYALLHSIDSMCHVRCAGSTLLRWWRPPLYILQWFSLCHIFRYAIIDQCNVGSGGRTLS